MTGHLVTIGITAFNAAGTIKRSVHSALAQTWRPIEIVAVDDCSTDGTWDVLLQLDAAYPEVHVFHNHSNGGVAVSRNRILKEARGEFVAFFDDDDESLPERVAAQLNQILAYEHDFAKGAPVVCHTARRVLYPDGSSRIEPAMGEQKGRRAPNGLVVAERILLGTHLKDCYGAGPTCSQMSRLATYHAVGGFDSAFRRSEDTELNIRLAKTGAHFTGIPSPMVLQKMTLTTDKSLSQERHYMLMMLEKHRDVPDRYCMYGFCRQWVDIKHAWLEGRKDIFVLQLMCAGLTHPWQTLQRLTLALPNIGLNRAFGRFHGRSET